MKLEIGRAGWYAIFAFLHSPNCLSHNEEVVVVQYYTYLSTFRESYYSYMQYTYDKASYKRLHTYSFSISKYLLQCISSSDSILTVIESEYI